LDVTLADLIAPLIADVDGGDDGDPPSLVADAD
jgi:hypothetical protein